MNCPFLTTLCECPTERLAINRNDISPCYLLYGLNPCQKRLLQLFWVKQEKDPTKCVMGRDTMWQFEKLPKPFFLCLGEFFYFWPNVSMTDYGAQGQHNNGNEGMSFSFIHLV